MSQKSSFWIGMVVLFAFGNVSQAVEPPQSPRLSLIWNDAYKLLPISFDGIAKEVTNIFEEIGIEVIWTKAGQGEVDEIGAVRVRVILMPELSSKWSLPKNTMGVVIGEKVPRQAAFISYSGVLRTLGYEPTPERARSPRERALISRAMGRVIGHELAHAIVPDRDHDSGGLLSANLKRSHLKKSNLRFLDATAKAFAGALAAFEDRLAASQMATNQPALN